MLYAPSHQDVQFGDLDVMYDWLTFTYDENNTYNSYADLPEFIRELKARGIHFIQSVVMSEMFTAPHAKV